MIVELAKKIKRKKLQKIIPVFWIVGIGSFGFLSTVALISTDMSSAQFEAASFILQNNTNGQNTTILAGPAYSWIFNDVFHMENVLLDYSQILFEPIKTDKILLVADPHFFLEQKRGAQLQLAYDVTNTTKQFTGNVGNYDTSKYPYHSLNYNREGEVIEIRKGSARSLQWDYHSQNEEINRYVNSLKVRHVNNLDNMKENTNHISIVIPTYNES